MASLALPLKSRDVVKQCGKLMNSSVKNSAQIVDFSAEANAIIKEDFSDFHEALISSSKFYDKAAKIFPTLRGEDDDDLHLEDIVEIANKSGRIPSENVGLVSDKFEAAVAKKFMREYSSLVITNSSGMHKDTRMAIANAFRDIFAVMGKWTLQCCSITPIAQHYHSA